MMPSSFKRTVNIRPSKLLRDTSQNVHVLISELPKCNDVVFSAVSAIVPSGNDDFADCTDSGRRGQADYRKAIGLQSSAAYLKFQQCLLP